MHTTDRMTVSRGKTDETTRELLDELNQIKIATERLCHQLAVTPLTGLKNQEDRNDWDQISEKVRINRTLIRELHGQFHQSHAKHKELGQLIKELIRNDRSIIERLKRLRRFKYDVPIEVRELGNDILISSINGLRFVKSLKNIEKFYPQKSPNAH